MHGDRTVQTSAAVQRRRNDLLAIRSPFSGDRWGSPGGTWCPLSSHLPPELASQQPPASASQDADMPVAAGLCPPQRRFTARMPGFSPLPLNSSASEVGTERIPRGQGRQERGKEVLVMEAWASLTWTAPHPCGPQTLPYCSPDELLKMGSHCVAMAALKSTEIHLPLLPKGWD